MGRAASAARSSVPSSPSRLASQPMSLRVFPRSRRRSSLASRLMAFGALSGTHKSARGAASSGMRRESRKGNPGATSESSASEEASARHNSSTVQSLPFVDGTIKVAPRAVLAVRFSSPRVRPIMRPIWDHSRRSTVSSFKGCGNADILILSTFPALGSLSATSAMSSGRTPAARSMFRRARSSGCAMLAPSRSRTGNASASSRSSRRASPVVTQSSLLVHTSGWRGISGSRCLQKAARAASTASLGRSRARFLAFSRAPHIVCGPKSSGRFPRASARRPAAQSMAAAFQSL